MIKMNLVDIDIHNMDNDITTEHKKVSPQGSENLGGMKGKTSMTHNKITNQNRKKKDSKYADFSVEKIRDALNKKLPEIEGTVPDTGFGGLFL